MLGNIVIGNKEYLKLIVSIGSYKYGNAVVEFTKLIQHIYNSNNVYLFGNARSAEYIFLKSLDLPKSSNIAVQGFTCNALINPILWLGLEPRYIDIDSKSFNMSLESLKERVDENTKVIIFQHTFGNSEGLEEVLGFAKERGIFVLEDCAHSLGVENQQGMLGTFGDASIISFGAEKILSTKAGGALIVNNFDLVNAVEGLYEELPVMTDFRTFIFLTNPIVWRFLRWFGNAGFSIAKVLNKIGLLSMGFERCEIKGIKPSYYPEKLSNALSKVVLAQIDGLKENLDHRIAITNLYNTELLALQDIQIQNKAIPYVKYPLVLDSSEIKKSFTDYLNSSNVYWGDWYSTPIYPNFTDMAAMKYEKGSCPNADDISSRIVNLLNSPAVTESEAKRTTGTIKKFFDNR